MNRQPLYPLDILFGLLLILVFAVAFARLCTAKGCRRYIEGPRSRYCRECGTRLIWWWKVPADPKFQG